MAYDTDEQRRAAIILTKRAYYQRNREILKLQRELDISIDDARALWRSANEASRPTSSSAIDSR